MKRKYKIILSVVAVCILLSACIPTQPNTPVDLNTYTQNMPATQQEQAQPSVKPTPMSTSVPVTTPKPTMEPPKNAEGNYYLIGINPPYEEDSLTSYLQIEGQDFMMAGKKYSNGITLNYNKAYGLFNLEGKYQEITFTIGHVDKTRMESAVVGFFVDGQEVKSIEVLPEDMPTDVTIAVNGGSQLKILQTCSGSVGVGLAEIIGK